MFREDIPRFAIFSLVTNNFEISDRVPLNSSSFLILFLNLTVFVLCCGPQGTEEYREGRLQSNANAMGLSSDLNVGTQDNDTQMFM